MVAGTVRVHACDPKLMELAFGRGSIRDPLVTSRLRNFFELGENGGALQVDITGATGVTDQDRRNNIAGLGLKYKWFPLVGYPFPVITLAGDLTLITRYGLMGAAVTSAVAYTAKALALVAIFVAVTVPRAESCRTTDGSRQAA